MKKEIKNLPASVHDRLRLIAKERGRPFQEIFYYYAIERFLYRLSQSKHVHSFVLKGALMFQGWGLPLRRPTRDIDVQGNMVADTQALAEIVRKICNQPVEPDGMWFDHETVRGEQINLDANQPGIRFSHKGFLGKAQIWMQLDVSFANPIVPSEIRVNYPTLLSDSSFQLRGYPYETVIAEKLQSMVALGLINDRLKDFYDIWLLAQQVDIQGSVLVRAISATFQARKTPIPSDLPVALSDDFVQEKGQAWQRFLRRTRMDDFDAPVLDQVIKDLRPFLLPALLAARRGGEFNATWLSGREWKKNV
jgi:predicted nucleotidyltransferase component of viral defense system